MSYTFNDDSISIIDANLNQIAVSQSQIISTVSQSGFIQMGVSGTTAIYTQVDSQGNQIVTGSFTVNNFPVTQSVKIDQSLILTVSGVNSNNSVGDPSPVIIGGRDGTFIRTVATDVSGQIKVIVQQPSDAISITLSYDQTVAVAGAQANYFYNALTYTIPNGYKFVTAQYNSYSSDNRVTARVSKFISLGTYNIGFLNFSSGDSYNLPGFASYLEAEVTTVIGGASDITLTVTYTNQNGISGKNATIAIKKNTPVGYKSLASLASGDFGILSIQSVSSTPSNTGVVQFKAGVDFFVQTMNIAGQNYIIVPPPAAQIVDAGEIVELAWASNAAATSERIIKVAGVLQTV